MTVLRLVGATLTSATASLVCVATIPFVGVGTTVDLWLTIGGIAAGLVAICSGVLAMVALMPPQPLIAPQEPAKPIVRVSVVRDALPTATRPYTGRNGSTITNGTSPFARPSIELPAGSVR